MKLSYRANKRSGFTLVEVMVAGTASALVLGCLCSIYFAIARSWERQQGQASALMATSQACSRIADYLSQATGVVVVDRFTTGDAIAVVLPADSISGGFYVPTWSGGTLQYRSGQWIAFYLSDSSGSIYRSGDILWAGCVTWTYCGTWIVTPDKAWSLYYSSSRGRISPINCIKFVEQQVGSRTAVKITVAANYKVGNTTQQLSQTRTVCLRNSE